VRAKATIVLPAHECLAVSLLILGDASSSRFDHPVSLLVYGVNLEVVHHVHNLTVQSENTVVCQ
jgi:hypothetical protein